MARCPLCGGTARLGLAKTQLPVMTMNCCNAQLFARSDRSDRLLRELLQPTASAPAQAAIPAPAPVRAPAPEPVRTEKPEPTGFGLMKW